MSQASGAAVRPPNPITQGLRAARRDPAALLVEILWRWTFWMAALFLLAMAGMALLGPLHVGDSFLAAWRTQDARKMGVLAYFVVLRLGTKLAMAAVALALGLALLWSIFAAWARRVVVMRLSASAPLGFGAMLAAQWLRALVMLAAVFLLLATVTGATYAATRGPQPDLFRFYMVCWPAIPPILAIWLALNWLLSMAAIFGEEGQGIVEALRQARKTVRRQRSDFAGTAFLFLLLRVAGLLVAVAAIGLTSSMLASAPQSYAALVMTVALAYFILMDFLYVARTGAYLALAAYASAGLC